MASVGCGGCVAAKLRVPREVQLARRRAARAEVPFGLRSRGGGGSAGQGGDAWARLSAGGSGGAVGSALALGAAVALSVTLSGPAAAAIIVGEDYQPALGMKTGIPEQCTKVCKKNPPACAPCKKRVAQGLS